MVLSLKVEFNLPANCTKSNTTKWDIYSLWILRREFCIWVCCVLKKKKKKAEEITHNNTGNITQKYLGYHMNSRLWNLNPRISPQITFQVWKKKKKATFCFWDYTVNYEIKFANSRQCIFISNDQFQTVKAHKSLKMLTKLYSQKGIFSHSKWN